MWKNESIEPMKTISNKHGKGFLIARRYWDAEGLSPTKRKEFFIVKLKKNSEIVYFNERPKPYKPCFSWDSWDGFSDNKR